MAQREDNFKLFGNDVIQCFYDTATVCGDPIRRRALLYVEQVNETFLLDALPVVCSSPHKNPEKTHALYDTI